MRRGMSNKYTIVWGEFRFWSDETDGDCKMSLSFTWDGEPKRMTESYPNIKYFKDKYNNEKLQRGRVVAYINDALKHCDTVKDLYYRLG